MVIDTAFVQGECISILVQYLYVDRTFSDRFSCIQVFYLMGLFQQSIL